MQYREFGKTGILVSAVGMGANRFRLSEQATAEEIEHCAQIVINAASAGVNFFDSATTYSAGKCEEILRLAIPQIKEPYHICGKSSSYQEKTRDSVLRHIEASLKNMGIDRFDFYYMWSLKSMAQYRMIMSKGGAYEGVVEAKERGLIKHICFSSHASRQDTIAIMQEGAFEGVLISYSLLNFHENNVILEVAKENKMGVSVMNPLGGGLIPQNAELFSGSSLQGDRDIVDAALKFVYANPAVSSVLCGISENRELEANVQSLSSEDKDAQIRQGYVASHLDRFSEFCTGCGYCNPCPAGIPVAQLMTAYNQTKFQSNTFIYNRTSKDLIKRGHFFGKVDGLVTFECDRNPCIKCGKCETVCTQSLPVMRVVAQIYGWVSQSCVSVAGRRKRLQDRIHPEYKRVGFYTAGVYTSFVMDLYKQLFGTFTFSVYVFDSNPTKWGSTYLEEITVKDPKEIPLLDLDVLLISNYIHSDSLYKELIIRFPHTNIQKLHEDDDVPWMF